MVRCVTRGDEASNEPTTGSNEQGIQQTHRSESGLTGLRLFLLAHSEGCCSSEGFQRSNVC